MTDNDELPPIPDVTARALPSYLKTIGVLEHLAEVLAKVEKEARTTGKMTGVELARAFVCMHRIDKALDSLSKSYGLVYDEFKTQVLPQVLEDEGVTNVPLAEGFRVGVSTKLYASIKGGKKEEAYEWLRNNGFSELIVETVNASTLSAAVKVRLEEDFLDLPDDLFNAIIQNNTSVTKTKPKG